MGEGWRQKFVEGEEENEKATREDGPLIVEWDAARISVLGCTPVGGMPGVDAIPFALLCSVDPLSASHCFSRPTVTPTIHTPCPKGAPITSPP